jgi:hypothetical protein
MLQSFCKGRHARYWIVLGTHGWEDEDEGEGEEVEGQDEELITMVLACEKELTEAEEKRR